MFRDFDITMKKTVHLSWDCGQARAEIALQSGDDANDPATARLLETHLTECEDCRQYVGRMQASLEVLQSCAVESVPALRSRSLWPGIAARLPVSIRPSTAARFNVWVPTAAMAVACSAMLLVTIVQLERVIPHEAASHWKMALGQEQERDLFPKFSADRLKLVKTPAGSPSAVPVRLRGPSPFVPVGHQPDF